MAVQIGSAYGTIEIGTSGAIQSVQSLSSTLRSVGTTMTTAISAPLLGAAAVALKSAGDFEQSMNIMQQVSKATDEQMAQMQSAALQWGAETVFSAGEVADGMLEMSKAGFEVDDVMSAMPGVMNLAAAANMDLASAGEITANVINAFGLESSKATEIADLLAATANSSSLEITDLGYSFQMASAVAHQFGLSADELAASLAIMGDQGLKGSDAGTSFKTMLMRLMSPTDKAKDVLDELGVSVFDSAGAMRAYPDIMADLQQALYGTTEAMVTTGGRTKEQEAEMRRYAKMIQSTKQKLADYANGVAGVRQSEAKKAQTIDQLNRELVAQEAAYNKLAGIQGTTTAVARTLSEEERAAAMNILFGSDAIRAANILLPEFASKYQEASTAVNEQGAAADVANARMKGFNGAIEYLKGSIDSFLIGTALPFLDMFGGLVRYVADGITAFGGLSQPLKNAALAFAAVLAAAGPVMLALSYISTVLGVLLSPLGLITVAVATLAAAWVGNWGGIQEITFAAWAAIQPILMGAYTWLQTNIPIALAALSAWWSTTWPALATTAQTVWTNISSAISTAWAAIQPVWGMIYTWLQTYIPLGLTMLQTWWNTTWPQLQSAVATAWATIGPTFNLVYTWLQTYIPLAISTLQSWWNSAWATISPIVSTAWGVIQPILNSVYAWLQTNIPTSLGELQALWNTAWPVISAAVSTAWGMMQTVFNTIYTFATVTIPMGVLYLQGIWNSIWASISATTTTTTSTITTIWNALVALFGPSIENLKTSFGEMVAGFSTMGPEFQALWAAVQPVIEQLKMAVMVLGAIVAGIIGGAVLVAINAMAAAFRNLPAIVRLVVAQITSVLNFIHSTVSNVTALVQAVIDGNWTAAWDAALAVVSGLVTFIQGTVANALLGAGILIQLIGDTIVGILAGLGFDTAAATVQGFIDKIVSLVDWIGKLVKGDISVSLKAPEWVNSLISLFSAGTEAASGALEKAMIASWDALLATFAFPVIVWPAAGWSTWIKFPDITFPGWDTWISFPDIDWPGWNNWIKFPTIPEFPGWSSFWSWLKGDTQSAGGRSYAYGQLSALNERGRELVSIPADQGILPPGSRVYTNGQSNRMLAGAGDGGIVINLNGTVINSDRDIHSLANELGSLLKRKR